MTPTLERPNRLPEATSRTCVGRRAAPVLVLGLCLLGLAACVGDPFRAGGAVLDDASAPLPDASKPGSGDDSGGATIDGGSGDATTSDVLQLEAGADADTGAPLPRAVADAVFARRYGETDDQTLLALALDTQDAIHLAGNLAGTVEFGGAPVTSAGKRDAFFAKLTSNGAHVWTRTFGDAEEQTGTSIAVDGAGQVFVGGGYTGLIDLSVAAYNNNSTAYDGFIALLDGDGVLRDHKVVTGGGPQLLRTISGHPTKGARFAIEAAGDFVIDGPTEYRTRGVDVVFGSAFGNQTARLDHYAEDLDQRVLGLAHDPSANVYVTGSFEGALQFGLAPSRMQSNGATDVFVVKFDSLTRHQWSRSFGNATTQSGTAVAADGTNGVYVGGEFTGTIAFDGTTLTSRGGTDVFLLKLDAAGAVVFARGFGSTGDDTLGAVTVGSGGVAIAGSFDGAIDFGAGAMPSVGGRNAYVAKFGPSGAHVASFVFGDGDSRAVAAAFDKTGKLVVGGSFKNRLVFSTGTLTSKGGDDVFVAKLTLP
ncbi:MAG: hypothetical protein U0169_17505 [Polyangiaceae bacterium]